jgi:hypothetical protein
VDSPHRLGLSLDGELDGSPPVSSKRSRAAFA